MPYATAEDMFNVFGESNVSGWADIENTQDEDLIAARYAWALGLADVEIDGRLSGQCPYAVPFASPPPALITYLAAMWAAVLLYDSRGATDYDSDGVARHALQNSINRFDTNIKRICGGSIRFPGVARIVSSVPHVVREVRRTYIRHFGPDANGDYFHTHRPGSIDA